MQTRTIPLGDPQQATRFAESMISYGEKVEAAKPKKGFKPRTMIQITPEVSLATKIGNNVSNAKATGTKAVGTGNKVVPTNWERPMTATRMVQIGKGFNRKVKHFAKGTRRRAAADSFQCRIAQDTGHTKLLAFNGKKLVGSAEWNLGSFTVLKAKEADKDHIVKSKDGVEHDLS